ncbi:MAG: NADH-quinone oxidoreductase subunit J [Thermoplasmatota archaeon]
MIGAQIAFALLSLWTLAGGMFAVTAKRTFHAAMGLGVALVGVAGIFIQLGSPFIGVVQVLVYVGGILTLFVFAVMFVAGDEEEENMEVEA